MNVVLIGYRGTGKTTVAEHLSTLLDWPWVDSDAEVERRAGKSIRAIFEDEGEAGFRDRESEVVAELCGRDRHVLALGGGAVLREENRQAIRQAGKSVWLQALPETIETRISFDRNTAERRPNLTNRGGLNEICEVLTQREPIYRHAADLAVDTEGKQPGQVAQEIIAGLDL